LVLFANDQSAERATAILMCDHIVF